LKQISCKNTVLVIIATLLLHACAGGPKPKPPTEPDLVSGAKPVTEKSRLNAIQKAQLQEAVDNINSKKYDLAKKSLRKLNSSAPPDSLVLSNLAAIAYSESDLKEAQKLADKSLSLNPQNPQANNILGLLAVENGDISEAEQAYIRALTVNGNYANAHYNVALIYDIFYQDLPSAIQHYRAYLTLSDFKDQLTLDWMQELERTLEEKK